VHSNPLNKALIIPLAHKAPAGFLFLRSIIRRNACRSCLKKAAG
jgi:hypothetical protein